MTRMIVLTLLNLALPFLLRAIYIYVKRFIAKRQMKRGVIDITPPPWHFPAVKLFLYGVLLAIIFMAVYRFGFVEEGSFEGNKARDEVLSEQVNYYADRA